MTLNVHLFSVSARTSPPSWETQSVDRERERLEWLIHICFSYHTHTDAHKLHTHTPAHSCETGASRSGLFWQITAFICSLEPMTMPRLGVQLPGRLNGNHHWIHWMYSSFKKNFFKHMHSTEWGCFLR